jgi:transposase-like protein
MPEPAPGEELAAQGNLARSFSPPDPEFEPRPARRRFAASYKLEILRRADQCRRPGEIGELLRREGLYTSHLSAWRKQRDDGALRVLGSRRRGRKAKEVNPLAARLARAERENRRLEDELRKAKIIIDVQKKVSTLLGLPPSTSGDDEIE